MQYSFLTTYHQRMTRIVSALETDDSCSPISQPVDDLALTLISPLRSNDYDIPGHTLLISRNYSKIKHRTVNSTVHEYPFSATDYQPASFKTDS